MNIALPESKRTYVSERCESGRYGYTCEYVRELTGKVQREQARASASPGLRRAE